MKSQPYVLRFDIRAPPGPVVCNQARPARPLLKLRKLRFHGELAWGEPINQGGDISAIGQIGSVFAEHELEWVYRVRVRAFDFYRLLWWFMAFILVGRGAWLKYQVRMPIHATPLKKQEENFEKQLQREGKSLAPQLVARCLQPLARACGRTLSSPPGLTARRQDGRTKKSAPYLYVMPVLTRASWYLVSGQLFLGR